MSVRRGLIVICISVFCLSAGCERVSPDELLAQAEQAFLEKKHKAAVLLLKGVLQQQSNNARARWLLSEIYLDVEDGASAEKELERSRLLGVGEGAVLPSMARALVLQGKYVEALSLEPEGPIPNESEAEISASKAIAAYRNGNPELAQSLIDNALRLAPQSAHVLLSQAIVLRESGALEEALRVLDKIPERNSASAEVWGVRGGVLGDQKEFEKAVEAYTKAMNLSFSPIRYQVHRGLMRVALRDIAGASEDAKDATTKAPTMPEAQYLSGLIAFYQKDFKRAQEALEKANSIDRAHFQTRVLLAASEYYLGNIARAIEFVESVVVDHPNYVPGRKLLSALYIVQQNGKRAELSIRPVVNARPDDLVAKDLLASALIIQGRGADASPLLLDIAVKRSDSAVAQMRAGLGLLQAGKGDAGISLLETAVHLAPEDELVNKALIAELAKQGAASQSVIAAQRFVDLSPEDPSAVMLLADAHLANGDQHKANEALIKVIQLDPKNIEAHRKLASLAVANNDVTTAETYLQTILGQNPNDVKALLQLAGIVERQGDLARSRELLERAASEESTMVAPRVLLAQRMVADGNVEKALATLSGLNLENDSVGLATKADIYYRLGRMSDAKYELEALAKLVPRSIEVQFILADIYENLGETSKLRESLIRIREIDPLNEQARLAQARLLATDGDFVAAKKLLDGSRLPDTDVNLISTKLFVANKASNLDEEVHYAYRLFEVSPTSLTLRKWVHALERRGHLTEAIATLEKWLKNNPKDIPALTDLARLSDLTGDRVRTLSLLREIVVVEPSNVRALNNLAWLLREEDPLKALELAKRAFEMDNGNLAVLDTYSILLAQAGERESALKIVDRAIELAVPNDRYLLRKSEILLSFGNRAAASDSVQKIDLARLSPEERGMAEKIIKELDH